MPDLWTTNLGLQLANPLVPSASPVSRSVETIRYYPEPDELMPACHCWR